MMWQELRWDIAPTCISLDCSSEMAVLYWDEVLNPTVRLYATAVGPAFVYMDDNAHLHRDVIVDGCSIALCVNQNSTCQFYRCVFNFWH
ncbi:hypothetical protein CDAR_298301 [Caerostris darwini]|uniref:Uncharacterized protein n=1 Tax=Caerostris darwini TaxID=1538125 RepID=A0AAV4TMC5_9ARAC|nr:hypothetical protein CDAR_298301 [Caerostris darwini]